jgi:hypothetical protein
VTAHRLNRVANPLPFTENRRVFIGLQRAWLSVIDSSRSLHERGSNNSAHLRTLPVSRVCSHVDAFSCVRALQSLGAMDGALEWLQRAAGGRALVAPPLRPALEHEQDERQHERDGQTHDRTADELDSTVAALQPLERANDCPLFAIIFADPVGIHDPSLAPGASARGAAAQPCSPVAATDRRQSSPELTGISLESGGQISAAKARQATRNHPNRKTNAQLRMSCFQSGGAGVRYGLTVQTYHAGGAR